MTRNIHVIFKTHLDVGFTNHAAVVVQNYFEKYIPAALHVAREMREAGEPGGFIWTTGSWLIYEYLEQASPAQRKIMEEAIALGEIAWHALPFTTHTELMDAELFRFGLSLSKSLDVRYGKKTIAAKFSDVPGHTRAIIPLLAEAGVKFLHIGVNPGSSVPDVPGLFRWQDEQGAEVLVMYESGYGSAFDIPGLEDSLAFGHTIDNTGPQSVEQVRDVFSRLRSQKPQANIFASTLNAFAEKLETVRSNLPIITNEIGDSWIHGVGSDPIKVSRYRELLRLRSRWLAEDAVAYTDARFFNFNRRLLLVPEHTWGMDEKSFLADHENYDIEKFTSARSQPNFRNFESSWAEKRAYPQLAVNALEDSPLAAEARDRLEKIRPQQPDLSDWELVPVGKIKITFKELDITFDQRTGGIKKLVHKKRDRVTEDCRFGILTYQTFSSADYEHFFKGYILPAEQKNEWSREDFTKPGLENTSAESRVWNPVVQRVFQRQRQNSREVLFHMVFESEPQKNYGAPGDVYLKYSLQAEQPGLKIDLQWFNKQASRLPEAIWFSFQPAKSDMGDWRIEKLGREISPLEVVPNGNRHLHASGKYVSHRYEHETLKITALDSPLVAPGQRSLLDFNNCQPDMKAGIHFCLLNNLWGTNFPMWFEEDCRFRFEINF